MKVEPFSIDVHELCRARRQAAPPLRPHRDQEEEVKKRCEMGGPRFVAANCAPDGTKSVPPELHFRHRPSRNSVMTSCDNRSVILFMADKSA